MAFSLQHVVPWGRTFAEYQRMFALTAADLQRRILGCADGPASFNAEATEQGARVISADPLYSCSRDEIRQRIDETYPQMIAQARKNYGDFVWEQFASVDELGRQRMAAMERFLEDYDAGRESGRYVSGELPSLPFADRAFDLALCSHFLFLYSEQLSEQFHIDSVVELCRVANETRIFPLVGLDIAPSPHVSAVMREMETRGWSARIETVPYEFQRGATQMMRITSPTL